MAEDGESGSQLPECILTAVQHLVDSPLVQTSVELLLQANCNTTDVNSCLVFTPTGEELKQLMPKLLGNGTPEFLLFLKRDDQD
jgi:hypothetical protein